ncbi:hypothetical protein ACFPPD_25495 [Cohnella suwonensis]|uniref:Uncharacterized protein n=1 Tax=Cohnella suwonensis TaxID=696072 RepID=A0ABW0M1T0_9BACL
MKRSWRFIVGFGAFGALLTFMFSLSNNPFGTTLTRSLYAFLVFTAIAAVVRVVLPQALSPAANRMEAKEDPSPEPNGRGTNFDVSTPDEGESLTDLLKEQWAGGKPDSGSAGGGFQPLQPKRLVSLDNPDPEEVVQAIRRLTDE